MELRYENDKLKAIIEEKEKSQKKIEQLYQERLAIELEKHQQTFLLEQKSKDETIEKLESENQMLKEENSSIESMKKEIEEYKKKEEEYKTEKGRKGASGHPEDGPSQCPDHTFDHGDIDDHRAGVFSLQ